jgi:hypothetical protein
MTGSCDNGFIFIGRNARSSDFARQLAVNFFDVSNIDRRLNRESFRPVHHRTDCSCAEIENVKR